MIEDLELEGEVFLPLVTRTAKSIAEMIDRERRPVRRILDVGSGPGVGTGELARTFPDAVVVAVDASPAMLERVTARAAQTGLARISTYRADVSDGLEGIERADLVWAAMLMHHVHDTTAVLRGLRNALATNGLLAIIDHGDPIGFLPDELGVGRPGLAERLTSADEAWLATMRRDYTAELAAAGFHPVTDYVVRLRLEPALSTEARRLLLRELGRMRHLFRSGLDDRDAAAIAVLMDEQHPLGIMRRPDVFLAASRRVCVARAA